MSIHHVVVPGLYVEVSGRDWTCVDSSLYGALMLVDSEVRSLSRLRCLHESCCIQEEWFPEEVEKLRRDLLLGDLGVVILADWHNPRAFGAVSFFDENTKR